MTTDFTNVTFSPTAAQEATRLISSEFDSYDSNPDSTLRNDDFASDQAKVDFVYRLIKTDDPSEAFTTFREGMTEVFRTQEVRLILKKVRETPEVWSALSSTEQEKVNKWLNSVFMGDRVTLGFCTEPYYEKTTSDSRFDLRDDGIFYQLLTEGESRDLTGLTSASFDAEKTFGSWMLHGVGGVEYNPSWSTRSTQTMEILDGEVLSEENEPEEGLTQNLPVEFSAAITRGAVFKMWGYVAPTLYFSQPADTPESSLSASGGLELRELELLRRKWSLAGQMNYEDEQYTQPPAIMTGASAQSTESLAATLSPSVSLNPKNAVSLDGQYKESSAQDYFSYTEGSAWTIAGAYQYTRKPGQSLRISVGAQTTDSLTDRSDIQETYETSANAAEGVVELRTPIWKKLSGVFTLDETFYDSTGNLTGSYFSGAQKIALEWAPKGFVNSISVLHSGYDWSLWYAPEVGSSYPEGEYTLGSQEYSVTAKTNWTPASQWTVSAQVAVSVTNQDGTFFPTNTRNPIGQISAQRKLGDNPRTVLYGYLYGYNESSQDQFEPGADQSELGYGGGLGLSISSIKLWVD